MDCTLGRLGRIAVSADGGATWIDVGSLLDGTADFSVETIDCTNHDSDGIRQQHPSFRSLSIDLTANYVDADPGQKIILDAMSASTEIGVRWRNLTGVGKREIGGRCFPNALNLTMPNEDKAEFGATLTVNAFVVGIQS